LVVAYADERLEIGFNAKYLLEISSQIDRENAVFLFNGRRRSGAGARRRRFQRRLCRHADAGLIVPSSSSENLARRAAWPRPRRQRLGF
jgi:hypothetical protein